MKLYDELAEWWPLVSAPADYASEAAEYARLLRLYARETVHDVLELGSGGGNNANFLKREFSLTLVEPSAGMRKVSRALNPECDHQAGDMRTVRLGRTFDAVFVHDAISYMRTEADVRDLLTIVALHLRPGGVALLTPDATVETFQPGTHVGGGDEPAATAGAPSRSLRYLEWTLPLEREGSKGYSVHYVLLLRDRDGSVRAVHDAHECGLFSRASWLRLIEAAGLVGRRDGLVFEGRAHDVFLAQKPAVVEYLQPQRPVESS